jgi:hypothetical protein
LSSNSLSAASFCFSRFGDEAFLAVLDRLFVRKKFLNVGAAPFICRGGFSILGNGVNGTENRARLRPILETGDGVSERIWRTRMLSQTVIHCVSPPPSSGQLRHDDRAEAHIPLLDTLVGFSDIGERICFRTRFDASPTSSSYGYDRAAARIE